VNALRGSTILATRAAEALGEALGGGGALGFASLAATWPVPKIALSRLAPAKEG